MKTLDELVKEMAGKTHLQQAELVGSEVQLVGELTQVATDYLACVQTESPGPLMLVAHEGELLRKQLLEYSVGDGVRMIARFTGLSSDPDCYHFALVSIVRSYTRDTKEKKKRDAEERRAASAQREAKERRQRTIILSIAGITAGFVVLGLLFQWLRQFSGLQICIGVFVVFMVIGLIGRIFD